MQSRLREIATSLSSELASPSVDTSTSLEAAAQPTNIMDYSHDVDNLEEINPLDLFCSSIDTLRGQSMDQIIPQNSGWSVRPTRSSGVAGLGDDGNRDEIQLMCRRGIPPSLRCACWIINVVRAANPDWSKSDCDDFGTFRKVRVIGEIELFYVVLSDIYYIYLRTYIMHTCNATLTFL